MSESVQMVETFIDGLRREYLLDEDEKLAAGPLEFLLFRTAAVNVAQFACGAGMISMDEYHSAYLRIEEIISGRDRLRTQLVSAMKDCESGFAGSALETLQGILRT